MQEGAHQKVSGVPDGECKTMLVKIGLSLLLLDVIAALPLAFMLGKYAGMH